MSNSTLAPSEKHLEDWIVANPQKFLPDCWAVSFTESLPCIEYIVARQVVLPYGIADLFIKCPMTTAIIELKKGVIDMETVGQCLRYMNCIERIREIVHVNMRFTDPNFKTPLKSETCGFICGHSMTDKNLPLVCRSVGITPVLYQYIDGEYQFASVYHDEKVTADQHYEDRARGAIGDALRREMYEWKHTYNIVLVDGA